MCNISIGTVIRANKRTIEQNRNPQIVSADMPISGKGLSIPVSFRGVTSSRVISIEEIKSFFGDAINTYIK